MARVASPFVFFVLLLFIFSTEVEGLRKCAATNVYTSNEPQIHCKCNATYCDDFPPLGDFNADEAVVYKSDRYGVRFERTVHKFKDGVDGGRGSIIVDTGNRRQTMNGFGGAWTDTIALLADKLAAGAQRNLIDTYYSKDWASCDFSDRLYSYDDHDGDNNLEHFALASEDLEHRIPQLNRAKTVAGDAGLRLLASPWSAPGWMKTNGNMKGAGTLKDPNGGPIWQVYANYILKYFEAYNSHGLQFWGLTPQNEPMISNDPNFWYQAMYFNADMEKTFVKSYLGPTLKGNSLTKGIHILLVDHNRDLLPDYPITILKDNQAASYVSGTAVHAYNDQSANADKLSQSIAHFSTGWTDWNMAVNPSGGPSWVKNVVDAPIYVDTSKNEFHKNAMFYFMGHFSKFVRPGTVAVSWASSGTSVRVAAFVDPNQSDRRILVIQNQDWGSGVSLSIQDKAKASRSLNLDLGPATIATVIWKKP